MFLSRSGIEGTSANSKRTKLKFKEFEINRVSHDLEQFTASRNSSIEFAVGKDRSL